MAKNWAIAIGINQYNNLQTLNYAKRDAEAMRDWFENKAQFDKVFLFTEDSPAIQTSSAPIPTQPTYGNLRRFLRANFETPLLAPGDNLWFFFAGHGCREADQDYIMLLDSDPGDVEHTGIPVDYVTQRLRRSGADNVVLFLDACRDQGSRVGVGIGGEHQGVVTFYACSPRQKSYEIEQLQHGAFTQALLEGLNIAGVGNCATVERLDQYLQWRVVEINHTHRKPQQNPYVSAEPAAKLHLILLPDYASLADIATLKNEAFQAEVKKDWELARQLWIRVNVAARGSDMQAIEAFSRINQQQGQSSPASSSSRQGSRSPTVKTREEKIAHYQQAFSKEVKREFPINQAARRRLQQLQRSLQLSDDDIADIEQPLIAEKQAEQERLRQKQEAQFQQKLQQYERELIKIAQAGNSVNSFKDWLLQRSLGLKEADIAAIKDRVIVSHPTRVQPPQTNPFRVINRRPFLKWVGLGGAGLVSAVVGYELFHDPLAPKYTPPTEGSPKAFGLPLWTVDFKTVKVDEKGIVVDRFSKQAKFFKEDLGNSITLEMISIPAGSFQMGSPLGEKGRRDDEQPQHMVKVPTFFIGRFEVTQEQYQQIMGKNPSNFKGAKRPVERVSWNDAVEFCKKLSQKTGRKYRLPSEAEWEYACRAGTTTPFHFGNTITTDLANYNGDYTYASEYKGRNRGETTDVGSFPPNAFGLYDMHGNVWEWCADTWHDNYKGAPTDGSVWSDNQNSSQVLRGGSLIVNPENCRSAARNYFNPVDDDFNLGFRVVCGGGAARTL
ncbi:SUMF1/EgtB/PvdO family nonheme iron enzyme [Aetokthonos hydrillicola Thurmond2011]|jgi:formylglycine-generating enzyme required for sulfatase activity/uncharacterized caspase-like protein|uniref:SUMF1/EgtB/PvdO family nonheme iron enzyme n=1 Tax=Aetokthonos hydrillicola Thurmond2011 TaxID=2712845 RepID=A0AAP5IH25_9CYAN|nr:SUMF1/EgtB/PvdO family nonheme iron enzyme [Aetokthonos hydrillicola]MBO3459925.1 SUMF1/EgtB/PvdO family nonheme iron enzyme [Aetokthonos hydrillicola CCALA 1050]MBW4584042.1 SUMF1/EgtB/PvdO family nonheme iron enzyme [Aetokthonos hydrillicola CCALA 1050]MDR9900684.1 SUMF1/EgtB/PvdO family nonheme iron enzyme [Aetokthonos hydrillicola Thurmond2011]